MKKRHILGLILSLLFLAVCLMVFDAKAEAEGSTIEIYSADDMKRVSENPSGNFILMNDIDMKDVDWTPVDFTGTFDGNNHAILNLKVTKTSDALRTTYDGNYKTYDTSFAGLFGVLENAEVKNLSLMGINVKVEKDSPCFIGSIAGFAEGSNITNCVIDGRMQLDVSCKMFGVGGIVGYGGNGSIKETKAYVTLICIDHDKENRDEQFMGGAYSAGYLDVDKCFIKIDGYDSDHGYVHNGGLVGMYILYPLGNNYAGYITNTRVEGIITFFEDNTDRRAYCKDFMGEVMNWTYESSGNSSDFTRNEIKDYSKDLLPCDFENEEYDKNVVEGTCDEYGYTEYTCKTCGYTFKADFTPKVHSISNWTVVRGATVEDEGLEKGVCDNCQSEEYRFIPVLEPEPEVEIVVEPAPQVEDKKSENTDKSDAVTVIVLAIGAVISVGLVTAIIIVLSRGKKRR